MLCDFYVSTVLSNKTLGESRTMFLTPLNPQGLSFKHHTYENIGNPTLS